jgi:ubiquinone/menaquinone biosynthesis C-methylase UbiE
MNMLNHKRSVSDNATRGYGVLENFLSLQRSKIANRLIPIELRNGKILDIGCGSIPIFLNTILFKEKYGIDKIECRNSRNIQFVRHDFEEISVLPFQDNSFDVVSLLAVIEHIKPEKVSLLVDEIRRVLKPDKILILTTPAAWSDRLLRLMAKLRLVSSFEIEEHKDIYTTKKLKNILIQSGFLKSEIQTGYFEFFANIWVRAKK